MINSKTIALSILFALGALIPLDASAASTKLSCSVNVFTPRGQVEFTKKGGEMLVKGGEHVTLIWEANGATKATNKKRDPIALGGSETVFLKKTATYTYLFSAGSRKTECSVTLNVVDGAIAESSLSTDDTTPKISGNASRTKVVQVTVDDANGDRVYKSKNLKIKRGKWEATVSKALPVGTYEVTLYGDPKLKLNTLATSTLSILPKGTTANAGSLSVSMVPLLMGGNAAAGSSVPVAYVKLVNTSSATTTITGFRLSENGSAPDNVVIGFTTSDDKGGSRTTVGGTEGTTQFKNGIATVPLNATLAPGQLRIFTIKAILSRTSGSSSGTQLMINVAGVVTGAGVKGAFPIRGTTLTLTQ